MPLQRRVPKFGFKNPNKVVFKVLNLDDLQKLSEAYNTNTLDLSFFLQHGLVSKKDKVKVLGRGEVSNGISVTAHAFSESAKSNIEKAGGSTNLVS
jgi:large subunit ribosomal protein L15